MEIVIVPDLLTRIQFEGDISQVEAGYLVDIDDGDEFHERRQNHQTLT